MKVELTQLEIAVIEDALGHLKAAKPKKEKQAESIIKKLRGGK